MAIERAVEKLPSPSTPSSRDPGTRGPREDSTLFTPLERITRAAIRSFRERGVQNTKIIDIARLAKISRPNIYRYVNNIEELIRLVIVHQARHMIREFRIQDGPWHEALTDLFVQQVNTAYRDEIFMLIVEQAGSVAAKLLVDDNSVRTSLNEVIAPLIAKGRAAGEIRAGLSDEEIYYWLHYQTWSLTRDPRLHNTAEIRDLARKFVVGGLIATESLAPKPRKPGRKGS